MVDHPHKRSNPEPAAPFDDDEYELEPLDPAIVAAEERRAQEVAERTRMAIDIDAVYRDAEYSRGSEIVENWVHNFQYRFHIKHVLVGTALLAIATAIASLGYLVPAIFIFVLGSLFGLYFYLGWQDRMHQQEADERREEIYAKRRERALPSSTMTASTKTSPPIVPVERATATAVAFEVQPEPQPTATICHQFSRRTMVLAMVIAAVTLGLIHAFGSPAQTAALLGLIACGGLLIYALSIKPPMAAIFGWWFILALYVVLTIVSTAWGAG